ncbi:uncharacterized protein EI97DRAFT_256635 [Westerdykella ornata]|uniref:HNH domain-containing protein n=1 Tax=Westerdykella ornata TaxID=318751 RepID=A0A6A6JRK0_WESOR|nr:uncharacterized protein EI97DRAFT_256635 [Westerdykella ornata]KAF2278498.1 hypothetical protein EI97DRAFT_256635 [Westerdykella ornata]
MADPTPEEERINYETFRECVSEVVLKALAVPKEEEGAKGRKNRRRGRREGRRKGRMAGDDVVGGREGGKVAESKVEEQDADEEENARQGEEGESASDAEDLGEFIDYLTTLIFPTLPPTLRTLTSSTLKSLPQDLQTTYTLPLSPTFIESTLLPATLTPEIKDTLTAYTIPPPSSTAPTAAQNATTDADIQPLLTTLLSSYIDLTTTPPPPYSSTRTAECELCLRDWIPLTYHHLIPKSVHDKVRKRAWHRDDRLNSVAWLCRACHSFVHRVCGNEELARSYFTVDLLMAREDVQAWVKWVGRVRWKSR